MDVSTSFWLCSLLAVVSMSVTIGCLWCCICAMAWIADCESENDDVNTLNNTIKFISTSIHVNNFYTLNG